MVWAMASGMKQSPQGFDAAVTMTRWMFPYIGFMSLVALAGGILNTWKKFAVPAASPVLLNIALILSITLGAPLFARHGIEPIYAQAAGVMLGGLLQLGIQVPALLRLGLLPRIGVRWSTIRAAWADPTTRKVARLMLPALLGVKMCIRDRRHHDARQALTSALAQNVCLGVDGFIGGFERVADIADVPPLQVAMPHPPGLAMQGHLNVALGGIFGAEDAQPGIFGLRKPRIVESAQHQAFGVIQKLVGKTIQR